MGRSDRLYALVEELRARAPRLVSRQELAERLEVSARTVERDILTLQQAGVPIWTQRGRFGGYAIEHRTTLPPLNLEATEALAVMAALSVVPNQPFASAGRRAQQKLLAAMRDADVAKTHELATRIRTVGPDEPGPDNEVVRNIERAVVGRRVVDLVYGDRKGTSTTRTVEAHGLHLTSRAGYLIGWCRLRDAGRAFRLDRIEKAVVSDEVAPPRDLDPMLDWVEGALALDPTGAGVRATATTSSTTGRHGPPSWLEHDPVDRLSVDRTAALVRDVVAGLPDVEEHDHHGRPAWRLGADGPTFAAAQDGDRLWVEAAAGEVTERTTTSPDVYERHWGLTVRLDRADPGEVRRLVLAAYRLATIAATTALTWLDVIDLVATFDDTDDVDGADGRPALRRTSTGTTFASLDATAGAVHLRTSPDTAAALALAEPATFHLDRPDHPHHLDKEPLAVDLDTVGRHRLAALLRHAWEHAG
jgi:predicted DNA-binding transcriptional regulator YafY